MNDNILSLKLKIKPKWISHSHLPFLFSQCPLLNISYCPASEADLSQGRNLVRTYLILQHCN